MLAAIKVLAVERIWCFFRFDQFRILSTHFVSRKRTLAYGIPQCGVERWQLSGFVIWFNSLRGCFDITQLSLIRHGYFSTILLLIWGRLDIASKVAHEIKSWCKSMSILYDFWNAYSDERFLGRTRVPSICVTWESGEKKDTWHNAHHEGRAQCRHTCVSGEHNWCKSMGNRGCGKRDVSPPCEGDCWTVAPRKYPCSLNISKKKPSPPKKGTDS